MPLLLPPVYMQAMLSQFKGLVVDWRRGKVSRGPDGRAHAMTVDAAFWRDLEWWRDAFERSNCVPVGEERERGEAAVTGTDASDWGTGQLAWLDGGREEVVLQFTQAEKRRPINWREMLGSLRIFEVFGPRLKGRKVLVETDNMASKQAAEKMASKAGDMQELIRRLLELTAEYDILIHWTHTPGVKLIRPDQTSRGDACEEPRARLRAGVFSVVESRWGPFTEMLGAEREHVTGRREQESESPRDGGAVIGSEYGERLFLHPTYNTVGSALRLAGERMSAAAGMESVGGIVIVPWDEGGVRPPWARLLRHFAVVGRLEEGGSHLEASVLGKWQAVRARRGALILAFPRARAGAVKLLLRYDEGWRGEPEYVQAVTRGGGLCLPTGAFVYSGSDPPGGHGELYELVRPFDPRLDERPEGRIVGRPYRGKGPHLYLEKKGATWRPAAHQLWDVTGLVDRLEVKGQRHCDARFRFDAVRAEREIAHQRAEGLEDALGGETSNDESEGEADWDSDRGEGDPWPEAGEVQVGEDAGEVPARKTPDRRAPGSPVDAVERATREAGEPDDIRVVQRCQYEGQRCEGCGEPIGHGSEMWPSFRSFTHPVKRCVRLAGLEQRRRVAAAKEGDDAALCLGCEPEADPGEAAGSHQRQVQLQYRFSSDRLESVRRCLDGQCGVTDEEKVMCKGGCGRSLHMVKCAQVGTGFAALGNLKCDKCRMAGMLAAGIEPTVEVAKMALTTCTAELTLGSENTAVSYSEYFRLEKRFVESMGFAYDPRGPGSMATPLDCKESFKGFLLWLVISAERAKTFESITRAAQAIMSKRETRNWAKEPDVKALIKEIKQVHGEEHEPKTHVTRRMLRELLKTIVGKACATAQLAARWRLLLVLEALGGLRIGEATGGGDYHGLLANNLAIIATPDGEETVEAKIEHSKTGRSRFINFMGKTKVSQIDAAGIVRAYWRSCGLQTQKVREAGHLVERTDYSVVRFSLLAVTDAELDRLQIALSGSNQSLVKKRAANTKAYVKRRRFNAKGESKCYVNIAGGPKYGEQVRTVMAELARAGLSHRATVTKGPLLRSTLGGKSEVLTDMPSPPESLFSKMHALLEEAHARANRESPDPELDLQGLKHPKWGSHSLRRGGDKVARQHMQETGATEADIDIVFGWREKFYSEQMQLHYAGLTRSDRVKKARVTSMW